MEPPFALATKESSGPRPSVVTLSTTLNSAACITFMLESALLTSRVKSLINPPIFQYLHPVLVEVWYGWSHLLH